MSWSTFLIALMGVGMICAAVQAQPVGRVEWIAHRGESHIAPENTMAAFNLAWELGADTVELDVHLTRDGRLICIHDADTERTTGKKLIVAEHTLEELQKLDAGSWKSPQYAGEKMPVLEDALATIPEGKRMFVEVKVGPEAVPELVRVIRESGKSPEQIVIISFKPDTCAEAKRQLPSHKVYFLSGFRQNKETGAWTPTVQELIEAARRINADGLNVQARPPVDESFAKAVREAGFEFLVWTVDEPEVAQRMIDLGVDGITTNRTAWIRTQVREPSAR